MTRTPLRRGRAARDHVGAVEHDGDVGAETQLQPLERAEEPLALHGGLVVTPSGHRDVVAVDDELHSPGSQHRVERIGGVSDHAGWAGHLDALSACGLRGRGFALTGGCPSGGEGVETLGKSGGLACRLAQGANLVSGEPGGGSNMLFGRGVLAPQRAELRFRVAGAVGLAPDVGLGFGDHGFGPGGRRVGFLPPAGCVLDRVV